MKIVDKNWDDLQFGDFVVSNGWAFVTLSADRYGSAFVGTRHHCFLWNQREFFIDPKEKYRVLVLPNWLRKCSEALLKFIFRIEQ